MYDVWCEKVSNVCESKERSERRVGKGKQPQELRMRIWDWNARKGGLGSPVLVRNIQCTISKVSRRRALRTVHYSHAHSGCGAERMSR
jgi:hypothetical protein